LVPHVLAVPVPAEAGGAAPGGAAAHTDTPALWLVRCWEAQGSLCHAMGSYERAVRCWRAVLAVSNFRPPLPCCCCALDSPWECAFGATPAAASYRCVPTRGCSD